MFVVLVIGMLIVIALGASSVILTILNDRVGPWEQMMYLMDRSNDLADTAVIYRRIGMNKEAEMAFSDARQLNQRAMNIMLGSVGA